MDCSNNWIEFSDDGNAPLVSTNRECCDHLYKKEDLVQWRYS